MSGREVECVNDVRPGDRVTIPWEVLSVATDRDGDLASAVLGPVDTDDRPARSVTVQVHVDVLAYATSIQRNPNPLPTEPGTRFYGRAKNTSDQWWFVTASMTGEGAVDYVCAEGHRFGADAARAAHTYLVRLPDPEEAP